MTAKSDEESEQASHPLAQSRPGVYVQVVAPRRRKEKTLEPTVVLPGGAEPVDAITVPGETVAYQNIRESGFNFDPRRVSELPPARSQAPADQSSPPFQSRGPGHRFLPGSERPSDNSNGAPDLLVVHLPAPPRMPNISLSGAPLPNSERPRSATLLDAPASMRPDEPTASGKRGPSWGLLAGVAALSAIIAAALVVALREAPAADAEQTVQGIQEAAPLPAPSSDFPEPGLAPTPAAAVSAPAPRRELPTLGEPTPAAPAATAKASAPAEKPLPAAAPGRAAATPVATRAAVKPSAASEAKSSSASKASSQAAVASQASVTTAPATENQASQPSGDQRELPENPYLQ